MFFELSAIIHGMLSLLHSLQRILRPELNDRPDRSRYLLMSDVVGILYSFPLVVLGLIWLSFQTDWRVFSQYWAWLIVVMVTIIIFSRLHFFLMHALRSGHMIGSDGDFVGVILWASVLIFGHAAIWLFFLWIIVELILACRRSVNLDMKWSSLRSASLNAASLLIPALLSLTVYQYIGGQFPITGLSLQSLAPALVSVFIFALVYFLIWLPFLLYVTWVGKRLLAFTNSGGFFWFTVATMELPFISLPFGVLASGIFVEHGPVVLGIYFVGLLLIALLANQLSRSAEKSRRQAVQLMGLERLGRDLLAAPIDARDLPALLRQHIPEMFPCRRAVVWLAPETFLLRYPDGKDSHHVPAIWDWLLAESGPQGFLENAPLPWDDAPERHHALLAAPIIAPDTGEAIGGLFIELIALPQRWDRRALQEHFPALQNLADQIAIALQQAETYQKTLIHQRVNQELRLAGNIQASFLPEQLPEIPGWDIAARLEPARQTSGDFYDFFMLDEGRLGFLIADVADKGLGAALYMALGRTLLLTYAQVFPDNPAAVMQATNQRMLSDARAQMFITVFYGVLEPETGRLIYCNAGHHPPLLLGESLQKLQPNGMALGIDENAAWVAVSQKININDTLLLYTDGVVEANNPQGEFYGMSQLVEKAKEVAHQPGQWIIRAIWKDVLNFQGEASHGDDITLVCLRHRG